MGLHSQATVWVLRQHGRVDATVQSCRKRILTPLVQEYILLAASAGILQGANLLVNLVGARVLSPENYGTWSLLLNVVGYVGFTQLGVSNGMAREIPLARGGGKPSRVSLVQNAALGGTIVTSAMGCVILAWVNASGAVGRLSLFVVSATSIYFVANQFYVFVQTHFQSHARFRDLAKLQLVLAVAAVMALATCYSAGLGGIILGQGLALAAFCFLGWVRMKGQTQPSFNPSEWIDLVRIGLPIMLVSVGYTMLTTIDRWVVLRYIGIAAVGQYTFQLRLVTLPLLFVTIVANQFYPRMAEEYGRNESVRALLPLLRRQVSAIFILSVLSGLFLYLLLPPTVRLVWPSYSGGLSLTPILLVGMVVLAQCSALGVFLNVIGQQLNYLLVQIAVIPIAVAFSAAATSWSGSIYGTGIAALSSYLVYFIALMLLTIRAVRKTNYA